MKLARSRRSIRNADSTDISVVANTTHDAKIRWSLDTPRYQPMPMNPSSNAAATTMTARNSRPRNNVA